MPTGTDTMEAIIGSVGTEEACICNLVLESLVMDARSLDIATSRVAVDTSKGTSMMYIFTFATL
jgi:hypothetical protein